MSAMSVPLFMGSHRSAPAAVLFCTAPAYRNFCVASPATGCVRLNRLRLAATTPQLSSTGAPTARMQSLPSMS